MTDKMNYRKISHVTVEAEGKSWRKKVQNQFGK